MAGINGNFATGLTSGLSRAVQALGLGGNIRQQAQMQGMLMGSQAAKYGVDAATEQRALQLRQDPNFARALQAAGFPTSAIATFQAGGAPDKLGDNSLTMQKYGFRNTVLGNIGDPGTDPTKINQGTALLADKPYTPYSAVGNTGTVLNQATGGMTVGNKPLMDAYSANLAASHNQAVDTPSGVVLVNQRTGTAQPVIGPSGAPVMGSKSVEAGKVQREQKAKSTQALLSIKAAGSNLDRMADVATEIADSPYLDRITGVNSKLMDWPGGNAADLDAKLKNLKSQVGFAVLQAMRDASKTGGALGQVSDKENEMLQNNLAALDAAQSPAQFRQQLLNIVKYANGVKQRLNNAYAQQYGAIPADSQQPVATVTAPSAGAAPAGTIVRRGMLNGRPVVQYSDGSIGFAEQ